MPAYDHQHWRSLMARSTVSSQLAALKKQRLALEKKEQALKAKSFNKVLTKIIQMAKDADLTATDITQAMESGKSAKNIQHQKNSQASKKSALAGKKVPAKYRNPIKPEQTWTGRGVAPSWIQELKAEGKLDSALITQSASSS